MQWLADLIARLGTHGAYANASHSLADEREAAAHIERFLTRFDHPAGRAQIPAEPPLGTSAQVA